MSVPPPGSSGPDPTYATATGRSDVTMPRGELALLIAIVIFSVVTFLPITHNVSLFGIPLMAWMLWALMVIAPAVGLVLSLRSGKE